MTSPSLSMPVVRPSGRCLVVASGQCQAQPLAILGQMGFECAGFADPYAAMIELTRRPLLYRALVLSLQSLYREELLMIATVKRRLPHLEVWMTQASGREASLVDAMRLGADGLLDDEGLHRHAAGPDAPAAMPAYDAANSAPATMPTARAAEKDELLESPVTVPTDETNAGEPVLTADELRALLQEQPSMPPSGGEDG
jgi:hypothetical protein